MSDEDIGATVREWTDVIRRADFDKLIPGTHPGRFLKGSTVKAVALTLASYADANGRRVFPGVARLAVDLGIGYRVAGRCVVGLRDLGLIERVRRAVRRGARTERDMTDEYRLTLPENLLERLTVPTPSDFRAIVARVAKPHRQMSQARSDSQVSTAHSARSDSPVEPESNGAFGTHSGESNGVSGPNLTVSQTAATYTRTLTTSTTSHSDEDLRTDAAATRAGDAESETPDFLDVEPGRPSLRVVTGHAAGGPSPPQRGLWPAAVPPLGQPPPGETWRPAKPGETPGQMPPTAREQAITQIRRTLADRKRPSRRTA